MKRRKKLPLRPVQKRGGLTGAMLARELGVSAMTVSLVLSGRAGPSSEMIRRVTELAHARGYQPHAAARQLALRSQGWLHSNLVVVLVSPGDERLWPVLGIIERSGKLALVHVTTNAAAGLFRCRAQQPDLVVNLLPEPMPRERFLHLYEGGTRRQEEALARDLRRLLRIK